MCWEGWLGHVWETFRGCGEVVGKAVERFVEPNVYRKPRHVSKCIKTYRSVLHSPLEGPM